MTKPPERDPIKVVIDFRDEEDPIEGQLIEPASDAAHFRGWLALTALIERARRCRGIDDRVET
jgi:hypothetical protein